MSTTSEHSSEYVGPASSRSPLYREEGTLELPLALPDRPNNEVEHLNVRIMSPERSPLLALGVGTGFAFGIVALFWAWLALAS